MPHKTKKKPLVYSCSGASSCAQMANWMAVKMDREGLADMSCIAGVGGDVPSLVRRAKEAETIIAIDGCELSCAAASLKRHGLTCTLHYDLSKMGVEKKYHEDFKQNEAEQNYEIISKKIKSRLRD